MQKGAWSEVIIFGGAQTIVNARSIISTTGLMIPRQRAAVPQVNALHGVTADIKFIRPKALQN